MNLFDYKIINLIHQGNKSTIYKALRIPDMESVIIKVNTQSSNNNDNKKLKNEFILGSRFNDNNIIRYIDFTQYKNETAIILEDFGAISLKKALPTKGFNLIDFFKIAMQIVDGINSIHNKGIIHRNINPNNVLLNAETNNIKLIDFGISSEIEKIDETEEHQDVGDNLDYISPEQTGRLNHPIDHRTDFYSLGITFYELLSGQLPFRIKDSMEIIHSHIALKPIPLHEIKYDIPETVSKIILKLINKDPEDRYKSCNGIKHDLEKCISELSTFGNIGFFKLGAEDIPVKFQIPNKLYGREKEIKFLYNSFFLASRGNSEFFIIKGNMGVGKTALVNEFQKYAVNKSGYYIADKFDKYSKNTAYSAIARTISQLIKKILSHTDESIKHWKTKLLNSLDQNGQIIINIIKDVELIIGPQPDVPELDTVQSKKRFEITFNNFIKVFTEHEFPLVIFLDDLQWADSDSIDLLKLLVTNQNLQNLMIIGAYRDNEVDEFHPLTTMLENIRKFGVKPNKIDLLTLDTSHINELISETFLCPREKSIRLAELIQIKTGGNIYFIHEFLYNIYRKKMLSYDKVKGWDWEIRKIEKIEATDNVLEYISEKIKKLPEETLEILKLASCIGDRFSEKTLSILIDLNEKYISHFLFDALNAGILIKSENEYGFVHNRIIEAIYKLIPVNNKKKMHYKIGRTLLKESKKNNTIDNSIFQIVNQLNLGEVLIVNKNEKIETAELNLLAGKKSIKLTAFSQALYYFFSGLNLLTIDSKINNYEIAFPLMLNIAECKYLSGDHDFAEKKFYDALKFAENKYDKTRVYRHLITNYTLRQKTDEAIKLLIDGLALFDVDIPEDNNEIVALLQKEQSGVKKQIAGRDIMELVNLTVMDNEDFISIQSLFVTSSESLFYHNKNLAHLIFIKSVSMSLEHGNSKYSSIAYLLYGIVLAGRFNEYETGFKFGELAFILDEKINRNENKSRITQLFCTGLLHWKQPFVNSSKILYKNYIESIESGNSISAAFNLINYLIITEIKGEKLNSLLDECNNNISYFRKINNDYMLTTIQFLIQYAMALQGKTNSPWDLSDDNFNEETVHKKIKKDGIKIQLFHYYRIKEIVCYINNDNNRALEYAKKTGKYFTDAGSMHVSTEHPFYYSLILLKHCESTDGIKKNNYIKVIKKNQKLLKSWSDQCSDNFLHKYLLVEAGLAQLQGDNERAADYYNQAIESANENNFMHIEAVSYELAAKFFLKKGMNRIAAIYMIEAHRCFTSWGAFVKLEQLEKEYPNLFDRRLMIKENNERRVTDKLTSMDLASILKASQSLSSEIDLENLLIKLTHILMKNAGADKGLLILENDGDLIIEAEMDVYSEKPGILLSTPVSQSKHLATSIVNYVSRTGEDVILDNAYQANDYINDPYILKNHPKSIICTPILNQGKLVGILYLENNSTTGAFTPDRVEVLKHLSYQGAISIQNARLYNEQKKIVKDLKIVNKINDRLYEQYKKMNLTNAQKRMNPHFLFNAIHNIHALMRKDVKKAENALIMLGDIYHFLSDRSFKSLIPFDEEWKFMLNYIEFDEINYPGTTSFSINRSDNFDDVYIPPLTIQPLVENSIKHGLRKRNINEFLKVNARNLNGKVEIEVQDNGIGLETDDLYSGTLGNIRERLKYHYKKSNLIISNMKDNGVKVQIYFEQELRH